MISVIDYDKCSGCEICVDVCNMDVLRMNTEINKAFIAYREDCMTCYECMQSCPEEAITVLFEPGFVPASVSPSDASRSRG
jgi:NAD-dependent dihydropyrimidine dehydrogenase PreA subunit